MGAVCIKLVGLFTNGDYNYGHAYNQTVVDARYGLQHLEYFFLEGPSNKEWFTSVLDSMDDVISFQHNRQETGANWTQAFGEGQVDQIKLH